MLPMEIPSTFEGHHGSIFYSIKVVMKRNFMKSDYENETQFNVVSAVDLNKYFETAVRRLTDEI